MLIAVLVCGSAIGLGLGFGIGGLGGDDDSGGSFARTTVVADTETDTGAEIQLADGVRLTVVGASFQKATTASGRKRKRARVAVRVSLRNGGGTSVPAFPEGPGARLRLVVGDERISADPNATLPADGLARRLAPESTASGELRFETAGASTTMLADATTIRLRLGGRAVDVPLD